jgi:hypothetical protein
MADRSTKGSEKGGARRARRTGPEPGHEVALGRRNLMWLGATIGVIVLGFVALAVGSTTIAPILLVAGYLVGVPYALMTHGRGNAG